MARLRAGRGTWRAWQRGSRLASAGRSHGDIWLAYRLHSLTAPRLITWVALKAQHGQGFSKLYHFKAKFPAVLSLATAVYPDADVEVTDEGLLLKPSRRPVAPRLAAIR